MDDGTGGRSGITLGGILSIKQTPPYRIRDRTLLDLIRDDQISGNESKNTWKLFRHKLRLKLSGSGCNTTGAAPTLASHVHLHVTADGNRVRNDLAQLISVSSPPNNNNNNNNNTSSSIPPVEIESSPAPATEADVTGEQTPARMSLMSLLEVEGAAYFEGDDVAVDGDDVAVEEDDVAVEGGGDGGGGGYKYNNCCVCMVRHKGAAFIPCGHTFCRLCSRELFVKRASCPLCNNIILEILDIF